MAVINELIDFAIVEDMKFKLLGQSVHRKDCFQISSNYVTKRRGKVLALSRHEIFRHQLDGTNRLVIEVFTAEITSIWPYLFTHRPALAVFKHANVYTARAKNVCAVTRKLVVL